MLSSDYMENSAEKDGPKVKIWALYLVFSGSTATWLQPQEACNTDSACAAPHLGMVEEPRTAAFPRQVHQTPRPWGTCSSAPVVRTKSWWEGRERPAQPSRGPHAAGRPSPSRSRQAQPHWWLKVLWGRQQISWDLAPLKDRKVPNWDLTRA